MTNPANPSQLSEPTTPGPWRERAIDLGVDVAHRCACVAIFTAIAAPLAIGAGFPSGALLLITATAALLCGLAGAVFWRTRLSPPRRREGRGLAIVALVLLIWAGLWTLRPIAHLAMRAGASASQSLRNVLNSDGR